MHVLKSQLRPPEFGKPTHSTPSVQSNILCMAVQGPPDFVLSRRIRRSGHPALRKHCECGRGYGQRSRWNYTDAVIAAALGCLKSARIALPLS